MKVSFLGGARSVTGSATLVENGPMKFLVDCGMFQGNKDMEERNRNTRHYVAKGLSFILLTHAHIDHSGLIPRLVKEGFQGRVICTRATLDLCEVMLRDSGHVQEMEVEWEKRKAKRAGRKWREPLYTVEEAERSLGFFQAVKYDEIVDLAPGLKVRFRDAGHILGSAIIEVWVGENGNERKLVFSGDLGRLGQPIVRDPSTVKEADVLWLESTYGNRLHKSRDDTLKELLDIMRKAIGDGGKVIIPAFAVERTQDVIYVIGRFIREGLIPSLPVYIDSPLAISATEIFKKNEDCFDEETKRVLLSGENPLEFPEIIYARTTEESKAINEDARPGIIISASGMCDFGRIKHHLKHHLWRPESHIVIIGFQAEGTIGRRLVDGAKWVRLFGEDIAVKAHVHTLGGFSGHADQNELINWLSNFDNPGLRIFVNHGEEEVSLAFAEAIRKRFPFDVVVPRWREEMYLFGTTDALRTVQIAEELPGEEVQLTEKAYEDENLSALFQNLNRSYRKLIRKLKKKRPGSKIDPWLLKRLSEVSSRIEEIEAQL